VTQTQECKEVRSSTPKPPKGWQQLMFADATLILGDQFNSQVENGDNHRRAYSDHSKGQVAWRQRLMTLLPARGNLPDILEYQEDSLRASL
jgi:hypothetical protein